MNVKKIFFLGFLVATSVVFAMEPDDKVQKYNKNLEKFNRYWQHQYVRAGSQFFLFEPIKDQAHLDRQVGLSNGMINLNVEAVHHWLQESIVHGDDVWQAYLFSLEQTTPSHTPKDIDACIKQRKIYKLFPLVMHQQMFELAKYEVDNLNMPCQKDSEENHN